MTDGSGLVALGKNCGHVHSLMDCCAGVWSAENNIKQPSAPVMPCLPSVLVHDLWYQYKGDIQKLVPVVEFESTQAGPMYLFGHVHLVWKAQALHCALPPPQLDLTGSSKPFYVGMCMSVLHVKYVYHACSSHRGTATIFVLGMEPVSFAWANSSKPLLCLYSMFFFYQFYALF